MNLSQLRYFRKLAQIQHYTHAAEELCITQPALSNSIRQLENELGVPLFEQEGRTIRLTKWGRDFNEYVCEGLDSIDKGVSIAQEHADRLTGNIDIGTVYTVQSGYLPELMREYRERYGNKVDVRLYQGLTRPLVDMLERGDYDLIIGAYIEGKPALKFVPILWQSLCVVVHRDHPLASAESVSFEDIAGEKIITYREESQIGSEIVDAVEKQNAKLAVAQYCDDEITIGSMIESEHSLVGVSLDTLGLSPFKNLAILPIKDIPERFHPIYLIYRKQAFKTRAVENMIMLATEMAEREE